MPDNYFARYLPLLFQALVAVGLATVMVVLSTLLGRHRYSRAKFQPYECGMKPLQDAHVQFDIRYYLYALLFILFDIEIVFIVPWAIAAHSREIAGIPYLASIEVAIFIAVLFAGLAYAWKKGALKWE